LVHENPPILNSVGRIRDFHYSYLDDDILPVPVALARHFFQVRILSDKGPGIKTPVHPETSSAGNFYFKRFLNYDPVTHFTIIHAIRRSEEIEFQHDTHDFSDDTYASIALACRTVRSDEVRLSGAILMIRDSVAA